MSTNELTLTAEKKRTIALKITTYVVSILLAMLILSPFILMLYQTFGEEIKMVNGAGELFPHGDDKELARKIQWLCEHPDEYRKVAERCQKKASQYDISVMVDKYNKLYHSL